MSLVSFYSILPPEECIDRWNEVPLDGTYWYGYDVELEGYIHRYWHYLSEDKSVLYWPEYDLTS